MKRKINKISLLRFSILVGIFGTTIINSGYSLSSVTFATTTLEGYTSVIDDLTQLELLDHEYNCNQVLDFQEYYNHTTHNLEYYVYIFYDYNFDSGALDFYKSLPEARWKRHFENKIKSIIVNDVSYQPILISRSKNYYKFTLADNDGNLAKIFDSDNEDREYIVSDVTWFNSYSLINLSSSNDYSCISKFSDQSIHFKRHFISKGSFGNQEIEIIEDKVCKIIDKFIVCTTLGVEDKVSAFFGQHGLMKDNSIYVDNWFVCFNTSIDDDMDKLVEITLNYQETIYDINKYYVSAYCDTQFTKSELGELSQNLNSGLGSCESLSFSTVSHDYVTIYEGTHIIETTYTPWFGDLETYYSSIDNILDLNEISNTGFSESNPEEYINLSDEAKTFRWAVNFANTQKYGTTMTLNLMGAGSLLCFNTLHGSTCNSGVEILKLTYEDRKTGKVLSARVSDEPTPDDQEIIIEQFVNTAPRQRSLLEWLEDLIMSIFNWFKDAWPWFVGIGSAIIGIILLVLAINFLSPLFSGLSTARLSRKTHKFERKRLKEQIQSNSDDKQIVINLNDVTRYHPRRKKKGSK